MKNYQRIASLLQAVENCERMNNNEWKHKHIEHIEDMCNNGPSGGGIDSGTEFNWDKSSPYKLFFIVDFHHMNDAGYYDGWTNHEVIVTPDLAMEINLRITGKDRNYIKDYLYDVYHHWLTQDEE